MPELTVATYNVHQWFGSDGRRNFDRGVRAVRELNADILGLQEVTVPHQDEIPLMEDHLSGATGMRVVFGPTMLRGDTSFGNVLLHRHDLVEIRHHDLSLPGREPRGAIEVLLRAHGRSVHVVTTHLGVKAPERSSQVRHLLRVLDVSEGELFCLMGDFNHWLPGRDSLSDLNRRFGKSFRVRTFPARFPLFPLDRIWVRPRSQLERIQAHRSPTARLASDHLPLKATVRLL